MTQVKEEIKEDNNCIVKAFENNPISIIKEENDNKKIYYFKASDIGKALDIINIRTSIVNFEEDEKVVRNTYSSNFGFAFKLKMSNLKNFERTIY
jgi:hypothetical protein